MLTICSADCWSIFKHVSRPKYLPLFLGQSEQHSDTVTTTELYCDAALSLSLCTYFLSQPINSRRLDPQLFSSFFFRFLHTSPYFFLSHKISFFRHFLPCFSPFLSDILLGCVPLPRSSRWCTPAPGVILFIYVFMTSAPRPILIPLYPTQGTHLPIPARPTPPPSLPRGGGEGGGEAHIRDV
jgi:hypothetical protein